MGVEREGEDASVVVGSSSFSVTRHVRDDFVFLIRLCAKITSIFSKEDREKRGEEGTPSHPERYMLVCQTRASRLIPFCLT